MANKKVRRRRRNALYHMLLQRFGEVPCFICCAHVDLSQISLEHITPLSRGGTDDFANLAISHRVCNLKRGNRLLLIK